MHQLAAENLIHMACGSCVTLYKYALGFFVTGVKVARENLHLILKFFDNGRKHKQIIPNINNNLVIFKTNAQYYIETGA